MDGSNNSTTFVDSGPNSIAVTAYGDAKISTTDPASGSGCLVLDGDGDYLMTAANSNLALGNDDFSIRCKVYINGYQANNGLFTFGGIDSGLALSIYLGNWHLVTQGSGGVAIGAAVTGVWQDIEVKRTKESNTRQRLELLVNGSLLGAIIADSPAVLPNFTDNQLKIGYYYSPSFSINARVDQFEIIK
jgi:hypothetical protein